MTSDSTATVQLADPVDARFGIRISLIGPWFPAVVKDQETAQAVEEMGAAVAASLNATMSLPPSFEFLGAYACFLPADDGLTPPITASLSVFSHPTHPEETADVHEDEASGRSTVTPGKTVDVETVRLGADEPEVRFLAFGYRIAAPWARTLELKFTSPNLPFLYFLEDWFDNMVATLTMNEFVDAPRERRPGPLDPEPASGG